MANQVQMFLGISVFFIFMFLIPCDAINFACSAQLDISYIPLDVLPMDNSIFNRSVFPCGFTFGSASSSYQYEGTYEGDGRGPSIWDTYTHAHPEKIKDRSNGDLAIDQYHRYKDDIVNMRDMGMNAYRFSISWSRVLPNGTISGGLNAKGIEYYNNLINELISKGLEPFVTIFHWDVPQSLEREYGGFLSSRIIEDFRAYAEICYHEFGDRVKHWITFNEPHSFSNSGYNLGIFAPGRCSRSLGDCEEGNSGTEPYIVTHNQLLSHAAAVKTYREKYQVVQNGMIGITLISHWMVPMENSEEEDKEAAQLALDFMLGWFLDPLTYGDYPSSMKSLVGDRLPRFTEQESNLVGGSYDFLGLNYYTAMYAFKGPWVDKSGTYSADSGVHLMSEKGDGTPIGPKAGSDWLHVCPWGIFDLLVYIKDHYKNPTIFITENGVDEVNTNTTLEEALKDTMRIDFYQSHLLHVFMAISQENVDVRGYFAWSLMDNFEWNEGYTVRFGINYVDFKTMARYPKQSYNWFKNFLLS